LFSVYLTYGTIWWTYFSLLMTMEDKMTLFALGMLNSFFFQIRILIAKIWIKFELRL